MNMEKLPVADNIGTVSHPKQLNLVYEPRLLCNECRQKYATSLLSL